MPKRARAGDASEEWSGGLAGAASAPRRPRGGGARSSGRLKSLAAPFRALDADARRAQAAARLAALEADGAPDASAGALEGDDAEFYVDDEETERQSRARARPSGGDAPGGGSSAAALRAFADGRAGVRPLGELVAAELGLLGDALDAATGAVDLAAVRAAVRAGGGARGVPARAYVQTAAAPPRYPGRPHCSVCGFRGGYACARCGARFCSPPCAKQHQETRCLQGS
jgi:hypothetical protein